jgi:DeoR family transcriptional regulator, suf operon transcriptional repressor
MRRAAPETLRIKDAPMSDVTISGAGLRVMKLLVGNAPKSVSELVRATGVTRTAVTEQLSELVSAGLVERSTHRVPSRGRPRHLYKSTESALLKLYSNKQPLLVPAIWAAIREIGGEELAIEVLERVSEVAIEHYNAQITAKKAPERVRQFVDLVANEGAMLEAVGNGDGHLTIYRRSCPFANMLDEHRSVCHIDRAVLRAVAGREIHQIACRHDGAPCCAFQVVNGSNGR